MGVTSSIVANRDDSIEMNIADEATRDGPGSMHRHSSQPTSTIFSSLIARQKHSDGGLRPPGSLRSSGSFDPSSAAAMMLPSEAIDKVRKEYETLKLTKGQEIQALERKEQKLETENNRLRAELQALNKQCQKLRSERDTAMESSHNATERATALEQDREKIQRHFKIFRETKETEIQALLQAKRQLESTFQRLQAHGMATMDDRNFSENDNSNQMMRSTGIGGQSDWWAAPESETTSLFGSYAQLQNGSHVGYSESIPDMQGHSRALDNDQTLSSMTKDAWLTTSTSLLNVLPIADAAELTDSTILRCYVSSTLDVLSDVEALLSHDTLKTLIQNCEKEGCFLSIIHFTNVEDYRSLSDDHRSDVIQHDTVDYAVSKCTVFLSFIGKNLGRYTESEVAAGHFHSPGLKSASFYIKEYPNNVRSDSTDLIRRITESPSKRCTIYSSSSEVCQTALKEIAKSVRLEFGVQIENDSVLLQRHDSSNVECIEEVLVDPHMEQMQQELASLSNNPNMVQPVGLEKCLNRLEEVVTSPGPVPPLLVSGTYGSGKTLLLSSWTTQLRTRWPDLLILQHFVTGQNSIDAQPVIAFRRLLSQLCQHLSPGNQPPSQSYSSFDITRLRETLPRWLEQLSCRRNRRILLVIDSIDLIKETQRHFSWLLDPLHVGLRVVISVGVDSCPEEWRQFPTLHLEPLSIHSVKTLLKEHARIRNINIPPEWERDVISQCRTATTCHPLYVNLLSGLICSVCEGRTSENVFHACARKQDSTEVYHVLLCDIEAKCSNKEARNHLKAILQFLSCSRNGLSETEIRSLLPDLTWDAWMKFLRKLTTLYIVKEQAGLIVPHNSQIASYLYNNYVGNDVHERRYRQRMLSWLLKDHNERMTPRSTDLLLWLLHREDEREGLHKALRSPQVFHIMYSRGRNSELVELWSYLNEDKHTIARYYTEAMRKMEASSGGDVDTMSKIAQIYQSLGRFLKDMNLMEEAVSSLQRSLEIQETILDPDHPDVADSLHHLASVYARWGKLSTAEPLFKQSLELVESTVGRDHLRVAQELSALARIARKSGRKEAAERMQQQIVAITTRNGPISSNRLKRLKKRALRLEELTLGEDSLEVAQALNDLGVLYHLQNSLENAESFFRRSLKIRKKLVGSNHTDVAQSLHNLASICNERKKYSEAIDCMNDALQIRKSHTSRNDSSVVSTLKYLAVLYKKTKNYSKACEIYRELLQISIEVSGEDSGATANSLVNLAVSECQNKNLDTALPLYKRALDIYRHTDDGNSQQVSQTLKNIAVLLFQQGKLKEAALVYKESMGEKRTVDPTSPSW